ncbi:YdcF family protein [Massilia sp. 9096]|uniref:YdcF family protein n=1 Tax=Massilia sp. 9096 TaxID=1500894 RepID=UPI00056D3A45|nr:YdcF family protein [Massilia sp. 9096]
MTFTPLLDLINGISRDLILPPANLFLVIFIGLAIWRRWPRAGRIVAGTGLAALTFLSTNGGAHLFIAPLERETTPLRAPERAGAQAIVVLAAGRLQRAPEYGGRDVPDYVALARVRYAAHLQRITRLPVLVSGGGSSSNSDHGEPGYTYAQAMADALREDFGVPVRWIEGRSNNTAENAGYSAALLRKDGVKRILLVTDAMHMVRARAVFQRAGLEVVDAPTVFFSNQKVPLQAWVPSPEGMRRSWYAIYELIGNAWYELRAHAG